MIFPFQAPNADHPRSRGVYVCGYFGVVIFGGIIPARAGFTESGSPNGCSGGDHPRSRGVYRRPVLARGTRSGSSPLARGLLAAVPGEVLPDGIIPARAGFTDAALLACHVTPDHPRSRGVYLVGAFGVGSSLGSSPLARGLLEQARRSLRVVRIIPARAGFTGLCGTLSRYRRDHPRSRGVYMGEGFVVVFEGGSSPLARGLPAARSTPL